MQNFLAMSPESPVENNVASHLDSSSIANGVGKTEATSTRNGSHVESMVSLVDAIQLVPESEKEEKGKPRVTDDGARTGVEAFKDDSQLISSASKTPDSFTELFADATTNDDETLHRAINNACSSQNFFGPAKRLFLQEKDDEKLDIRAKQAVLHLTWTDSRIKEIEREIKVLRRDIDGLPADVEVKKTSKQPVYQHDLKRSTISEFRLNDESKAVPNNQRPAVEVLITDHSLQDLLLTGRMFNRQRPLIAQTQKLFLCACQKRREYCRYQKDCEFDPVHCSPFLDASLEKICYPMDSQGISRIPRQSCS
jgi:hypothetical protein